MLSFAAGVMLLRRGVLVKGLGWAGLSRKGSMLDACMCLCVLLVYSA